MLGVRNQWQQFLWALHKQQHHAHTAVTVPGAHEAVQRTGEGPCAPFRGVLTI